MPQAKLMLAMSQASVVIDVEQWISLAYTVK